MVRYYGRARQRININRKQIGLKMAGCIDGRGRPSWMSRYIKTRVNCNARVGCVDPVTGNLTGERRSYVNGVKTCVAKNGHLLIPEAPRSRGCAGGVYMLRHNVKCR
jgi:hypothetical protein